MTNPTTTDAAKQIQRFTFEWEGHAACMSPDSDGEYVTYADHLAAIAAARSEWERDVQVKAESAAKEIYRYTTGEYLLDESDGVAIAELTYIIAAAFTEVKSP